MCKCLEMSVYTGEITNIDPGTISKDVCTGKMVNVVGPCAMSNSVCVCTGEMVDMDSCVMSKDVCVH